jgi:hypothetical protein
MNSSGSNNYPYQSEEKHTMQTSSSSLQSSDTGSLLDKQNTNDGMYIRYTAANVTLPGQVPMPGQVAQSENHRSLNTTLNAMKNVLDNKISVQNQSTTKSISIPTTSQKNARTRIMPMRSNPLTEEEEKHQQSSDEYISVYSSDNHLFESHSDEIERNDRNNGTNNNNQNIDKLKNDVYQFKLTTEKLENDMMNELSTKIDDLRKEIARISDNTNLSQNDKNSLITSLEGNIVELRKYYQMRINEIRFDLEQKQKDLRKIQNPRGMNWDAGNIATLNTWIKECNKQQFIYDSVLDKIISQSKNINVSLLILCAVQLLINTSNLGLTDNNSNPNLVLGIKIVTSVISALTYVLTQYMSLEKFEENIKKYTSYTETLGNFMSDMVSIADIKLELRPDGDKFIVDNKDVYSNIYRTSPYIKQRDWIASIKDYNNYLNNLTTGGNDYRGRKQRLYNQYAALDLAHCYKNVRASANVNANTNPDANPNANSQANDVMLDIDHPNK